MTPQAALQQADRHCDMEGLPPASDVARQVDAEWTTGRVSTNEVVSALVAHHTAPETPGSTS